MGDESQSIRFDVAQVVETGLSRPLTGDFDGDGIDDVAARTQVAGTIAILRGAANDPLDSRRDISLDPGDALLAVTDLDGDGRADLVCARNTDSTVATYRSLGLSGFAPASRIVVGKPVFTIIAGDLAGDRRPDLVTFSLGYSGEIVSLVNRGDGSLRIGTRLAEQVMLPAATIGDFDGDSRPDLAVGDYLTPETPILRFYRNENDSTLTRWYEMPDPGWAWRGGLAAVDLDSDGKLDLVDYGNSQLVVLRGDGAGPFSEVARPSIARYPYNFLDPGSEVMRVSDFDQDGRSDVAIALRSGSCHSGGCSRIAVLFGVESGNLADGIQIMALEPNAGSRPGRGLTSGDFDGDGGVDLVAWFDLPPSGALVLILNDPTGGFRTPATLDLQSTPYSVASVRMMSQGPSRALLWDGSRTWAAIDSRPSGFAPLEPYAEGEVVSTADLSGDGLDDLVLAGAAGDAVMLNDGAGGFMAPEIYAGATHVACADFDGVGGRDLAGVNPAGEVVVRFNDGTGHFGSPLGHALTLGNPVSSVAGSDLDGDGRAELIVGHNNGAPRDTLTIHWNLSGSFSAGDAYEVGMLFRHSEDRPWMNTTHPSTIASGDFNGDARQDLFVVNATANDNPGSISVLLQRGHHLFSEAVDYLASRDPWEGVVADLDNDGRDDAAVVCDQDNWNGGVFLFHAGLDGGLVQVAPSPGVGLPAEHYPTSIALGDWNADDRHDLVVGNRFSRSLTFFRNMSPPPLTTATQLSLVSATSNAGGIEIVWQAEPGFVASLARSTGAGAWLTVATITGDGTGRLRWSEGNATPGSRVGYRLSWSEGGQVRTSAEVWIDVPASARFSLSFDGARPNPARNVPTLEFTLATDARATIEIFDLLGRRVIEEQVINPEPGRHRLALGRVQELAPGVYHARLVQSGRSVGTRFVVVD